MTVTWSIMKWLFAGVVLASMATGAAVGLLVGAGIYLLGGWI